MNIFKNRRLVLYVFFISLFLTVSCKTKELVKNDKVTVKKELSKNNEQEYYYVFLEANRKKLLGDYNSALALYYQCLEINPNSAIAASEISQINYQLNNIQTALKYAIMATKNEPDNKWYQYQLAQLYVSNNDFKNAIEVYKYLHKIEPNNHEITFYLASIYKQVNQLNEAIALLNEIEEKVGVNETTSVTKQQIFLNQGNKTKAYDEINKLILHFPNEPRYYGLLAEMFTRDNLLLKAEESYNKLFELDSLNPLGQLSIVDFYRKKVDYEKMFVAINKVVINENIDFQSKIITLATVLNSQQETSLYKNQVEQNLKIIKDNYPDKLESYTLYIDYLIKTTNYDLATIELEFIIKNFKTTEIIWEQLISIYSFQNNIKLMYEKSCAAIDSFPNYPTFYLFKGISALQLNKADESLSVLKTGLGLIENNNQLQTDFYIYLGEAYHETGNYKSSDYYFQEVLKIQPENYSVINNYSYYLSLRETNLDYAESISKKTIIAFPENSTYLDTYAWILYKLDKYQDALYYIQKAIEHGGIESGVIVEHYGDILYKSKNIEKAIEMWNLSKKLGNSSNELDLKIKNNSRE